MPLLFDDDHRQIATEAERVLAARFDAEALRGFVEPVGVHDADYWTVCRDMGWTGVAVAEEHGGLGLGALELALIAEATGRYAVGAPFLLTSYGAADAIVRHAEDDVAERLLPGLASGETVGTVLVEAPDALSLRLEDGRLHGTTPPVVAGFTASLLIAQAVDQDGSAKLALIELDDGHQARAVPSFDNSRLHARFDFAGHPVTILADAKGALRVAARMAIVAAFEQIGVAQASMDRARTYALEREAFGQPIGKFQAVKHRIAEMYVAIEVARGNGLRGLIAIDADAPDLPARAAAARLSAIEASEFAAREAIQIHGAIGVTWEHDLHLYYRRARALALELGSALFWEDIIADHLSGEGAA
jgi:acyl-CoA dehydrogenase